MYYCILFLVVKTRHSADKNNHKLTEKEPHFNLCNLSALSFFFYYCNRAKRLFHFLATVSMAKIRSNKVPSKVAAHEHIKSRINQLKSRLCITKIILNVQVSYLNVSLVFLFCFVLLQTWTIGLVILKLKSTLVGKLSSTSSFRLPLFSWVHRASIMQSSNESSKGWSLTEKKKKRRQIGQSTTEGKTLIS